MVGVRVKASLVNGHKEMCTLLFYYNNFIHKITKDQTAVQSSTICQFLYLGMVLSNRYITNFQFAG